MKKSLMILRDQSGASLMFVFAISLLLLVIGVSAVTAAGLNLGASVAQRDRNQLNLYAGGMERTIRAAMEQEEEDDAVINSTETSLGPKTLLGIILREAYVSTPTSLWTIGTWTIDTIPGVADGLVFVPNGIDADYEITLAWDMNIEGPPVQRCEVHGYEDYDEDGDLIFVIESVDPCIPQRVTVSGYVDVELMTTYVTRRDASGGAAATLTVMTETRYQVSVVLLEDACASTTTGCGRADDAIGYMRMEELPQWRIIRHGRTD